MDTIFFEKQEGMLCAQHALNMLMQEAMYTAVDLSEIARQLDQEENEVLEKKITKSQNMDDSGFFSVQVIAKALEPFGFDLIHIDHPTVAEFKAEPTKATAFICNMNEHWFTLRKFGNRQWFSLNSVKAGPELLSDTYLSIYIAQLSREGYSIFLINGILPESHADQIIAKNPVEAIKIEKPKKDFKPMSGAGQRLGSTAFSDQASSSNETGLSREDEELQMALMMSLAESGQPSNLSDATDARNKRDLSRFM